MTNTATLAKTQIISMMRSVSTRAASFLKLAQSTLSPLPWRRKLTKRNSPKPSQKRLTAAEIEVRIWAIVVLCVTAILMFIVVALIWRTTFVTQPMKQPSPMDMADQKMLNDIVLLIVGGIGGVMARKGVREAAEMIAAIDKSPSPMPPMAPTAPITYAAPAYAAPTYWTPPPPPSNPPHYLEPDEERALLAMARETTRGT